MAAKATWKRPAPAAREADITIDDVNIEELMGNGEGIRSDHCENQYGYALNAYAKFLKLKHWEVISF